MKTRESLGKLFRRHSVPADPRLVRSEEDGALRCLACGNRCRIPEGEYGLCRMRENRGGTLYVPGGYVTGLQVDPIEKKPFFHVFPGRDALSFGMAGCNLHCSFCQNWVSSQTLRDEEAGVSPHPVTAEEIVRLAAREQAPAMVSTYNEPLITSEWAVEVFKLAKERGLVCGYVSNGNASPEVLEFIRPYVDLYKVDLKTFSEANYRELGGRLENVLETIRRLHEMGFWMEVVTLLVPGFNDSEDELKGLAGFVASVSPDIPWHVTAFHPDYRMTVPRRTLPGDLERGVKAGKEAGLRFVYSGNLPGRTGELENTYCPSCRALLIQRVGFQVLENRMKGAQCPDCGARIPGVWEEEPPRQSGQAGIPRSVRR